MLIPNKKGVPHDEEKGLGHDKQRKVCGLRHDEFNVSKQHSLKKLFSFILVIQTKITLLSNEF